MRIQLPTVYTFKLHTTIVSFFSTLRLCRYAGERERALRLLGRFGNESSEHDAARSANLSGDARPVHRWVYTSLSCSYIVFAARGVDPLEVLGNVPVIEMHSVWLLFGSLTVVKWKQRVWYDELLHLVLTGVSVCVWCKQGLMCVTG